MVAKRVDHRRDDMKIEDTLEVMEANLEMAEKNWNNPDLSSKERFEARGAKNAYAHCINLVKAVLEKKGWV